MIQRQVKSVLRRSLAAVVTVLLQFLEILLQCRNPLDEIDQRNDRVSASIVGHTYLLARDLEARVPSVCRLPSERRHSPSRSTISQYRDTPQAPVLDDGGSHRPLEDNRGLGTKS